LQCRYMTQKIKLIMENELKEYLINKVNLFYQIISGKKSHPRDWIKFKNLFTPNSRLSASIKDENGFHKVITWTIDSYIERVDHFLSENDFYEIGKNYKTTISEKIAQVSCVYEAKRTEENSQILKEGINHIHFIYIDEDWKIISSIWEDKKD